MATTTGSSAFAMLKLIANLKWVAPESNVTVLTDANVDNGSIFSKNASNVFDVIILDHQEYVTQKEYDNLRQFVANGGTMIILDGNVFFAQV
jgi:N,N-dimethylformamidase beta subunit-like, C-terminal